MHLRGDYLSVYVPTTPNPTSGFFLMVPRADVIALAMSVDEALKYVISMGVVAPPMHVAPAHRRRRCRCPKSDRAERPAARLSRCRSGAGRRAPRRGDLAQARRSRHASPRQEPGAMR